MQGTNTYLLGTGHTRILIDTAQGLPSWTSAISRVLTSESCTVSHVLLTHWHTDHTSGTGALLKLCPEAKIYKHSAVDDDILPIKDGDVFTVEGATLRAVHTPGHTTDHLVFWLDEEGALFSGDSVLGHGTSVFEDYGTYLQSLEKTRSLFSPRRVVPVKIRMEKQKGESTPLTAMSSRTGQAKIDEYLQHRKLREEQILDALSRNDSTASMTPMDIVKVVYIDTPVELHEPAARGVEQILLKMRDVDKKVVDVGDTERGEQSWQLRPKGKI